MEKNLIERKVSREVQLALAREKQRQSGISPRAAGVIYKTQVLNWIYRCGFTTTKLIQDLLNRTSGSYLNALEQQGLIIKTETEKNVVKEFFTLTKDGLSEVEAKAEKLIRYIEINPFRVDQRLLKHNLIIQELTYKALQNQEINDFQTEREYQDKGLIKQPDCVWQTSSGNIGIEVELSPKFDRDLDQFISKILDTLENLDRNPLSLQKFKIYTTSEGLLDNYKRALRPGASFKIWDKDVRGHWKVIGRETVPRWSSSLISLEHIKPTCI